jgi:integrase
MENQEKKKSNPKGVFQKKDKNGKLNWYARISRTDGSGKEVQFVKRAESKSHAIRLRKELIETYTERREEGINGDKMNFRLLAEIYCEKKLFEAQYHGKEDAKRKIGGLRNYKTPLHYLEVLKESFGAKLIKNITHADIEIFKNKRLKTPSKRGERSIADVNRTLALMRTMFKFAVQNSWLSRSPFELGKPLISLADEQSRERVLTIAEEFRLLDVCKDSKKHLRPLLVTALDTAMRRGELLSLTWRDVDFNSHFITLTATATKTQKARIVPMTNRVCDELQTLWEQSDKKLSSSVFGLKDNFKRSFSTACKLAEIEGFRFHDCRHTAITRMIQAGLSPMEIMKISGHTQMNTFARYVNPNKEAVSRIADALTAFHANALVEHQNIAESGFIN